MKKTALSTLIFGFILTGCQSMVVPQNFQYKEIETRDFTLASWQKLTTPGQPVKIYIEGDGRAFNASGKPSLNPTPRGDMIRSTAFGDPCPNVVYLARPCQFINGGICSQRHWTTARFAPEVINSEAEAIRQIAGNSPVILIGYSGGANVAGLIAVNKPNINVKKVITIAGNLDHLAWTQYHNLPPLNESMSLESYHDQFAKIPQHHYAGSKDKVIPPQLIEAFVGDPAKVTIVQGADHGSGYEKIYPEIYSCRF